MTAADIYVLAAGPAGVLYVYPPGTHVVTDIEGEASPTDAIADTSAAGAATRVSAATPGDVVATIAAASTLTRVTAASVSASALTEAAAGVGRVGYAQLVAAGAGVESAGAVEHRAQAALTAAALLAADGVITTAGSVAYLYAAAELVATAVADLYAAGAPVAATGHPTAAGSHGAAVPSPGGAATGGTSSAGDVTRVGRATPTDVAVVVTATAEVERVAEGGAQASATITAQAFVTRNGRVVVDVHAGQPAAGHRAVEAAAVTVQGVVHLESVEAKAYVPSQLPLPASTRAAIEVAVSRAPLLALEAARALVSAQVARRPAVTLTAARRGPYAASAARSGPLVGDVSTGPLVVAVGRAGDLLAAAGRRSIELRVSRDPNPVTGDVDADPGIFELAASSSVPS